MAIWGNLESRNRFKRMGDQLGIYPPEVKAYNAKELNCMSNRLQFHGGYPQQDRMIRDKRRSLDRATKYSYQGAFVKKLYKEEEMQSMMEDEREALHILPARALINPNKLKADYDEKIISIGFEYNFNAGDIFEWCNTNSYWLIYLQDLTELAYFRANIRRCSYEIDWEDEDGKHSTYVSVRGPVETKIDYIQKHGISVDNPNYSINILMPKNKETLKQFKRYSKFYLQGLAEGDDPICWRVEAVDSISAPGILEINAVEYYINETEDDVEAGLVGVLKTKKINPNSEETEAAIVGETFIKPRLVYYYEFTGSAVAEWQYDKKLPVRIEIDKENPKKVKIGWAANTSGQFDLSYGDCTKTIVVESLF